MTAARPPSEPERSSPRTPFGARLCGAPRADRPSRSRRLVGAHFVAGRSPSSSPAPSPGPRPAPTDDRHRSGMSAVSASPTSVAALRAVLRRLLTVLVLAACAVTVLLAVPDLRPVMHEVSTMNPLLVAAAVGLELASCLGFVVIFRLFFAGLPKRAAHEMAWIQMGSGALLP